MVNGLLQAFSQRASGHIYNTLVLGLRHGALVDTRGRTYFCSTLELQQEKEGARLYFHSKYPKTEQFYWNTCCINKSGFLQF